MKIAGGGHKLHIRWHPDEPCQSETEGGEGAEATGGLLRSNLYVSRAEAQELVAMWREHRGWGNREAEDGDGTALRDRRAKAVFQDRAKFSRTVASVRGICALLLLAGIGLVCWAIGLLIWQFVEQYPSYSWPTVEGKVQSQDLRVAFKPHGRHHISKETQLALSYEYAVAGQTYSGDQYSLWSQKYDDEEESVRSFAKEHQQGMPITVHYNPQNPAQAVLAPGADWSGSVAWLIFGGFLVFIGWIVRWRLAAIRWA